jgi:hypothetical protein
MRFGVVAHDTIVPTTIRFEDETVDVGREYYGYVAEGFNFRNPRTVDNDVHGIRKCAGNVGAHTRLVAQALPAYFCFACK